MNLEHRVAMLEQTNRRHEQTNRRYRWCMIGLAALLLLTVGVGAVQVGEDGQLVLKRLVIEDDEGRERIVLGTWATGQASIQHLDANGKRRIDASTFSDGRAGITHFDANEKRRIAAATLADGNAAVWHYDANEKVRIGATTLADGNAAIVVTDADGQPVGSIP